MHGHHHRISSTFTELIAHLTGPPEFMEILDTRARFEVKLNWDHRGFLLGIWCQCCDRCLLCFFWEGLGFQEMEGIIWFSAEGFVVEVFNYINSINMSIC